MILPPSSRLFPLALLICLGAPPLLAQSNPPVPAIDTHTHFKSEAQIAEEAKTRKWEPQNTLGQVVLPDDYAKVAEANDIEATIFVEASGHDMPEVNDWALQQAADSKWICGYIARGDFLSDSFDEHHARYSQSPWFKGYRLRKEDITDLSLRPEALKRLGDISRDGYVIDVLATKEQLDAVINIAARLPDLKIVVNHCLHPQLANGGPSDEWKSAIDQLATHSNIYMKVSSIISFAGTKPFVEEAPSAAAYYAPMLDHLYQAFGEDRLIFGTNWGVCTHWGKTRDVVDIVRSFLRDQGDGIEEKGMRTNAIRVYNIDLE
jgi:L-fuconolactonase